MLSQLKQKPEGDSTPATKLYDKHRCCRQTIPTNLLQNISIGTRTDFSGLLLAPGLIPNNSGQLPFRILCFALLLIV